MLYGQTHSLALRACMTAKAVKVALANEKMDRTSVPKVTYTSAMWTYIDSLMTQVQRAAGDMGREQWIAVFVVALFVGAFLLRGFGLRSGY